MELPFTLETELERRIAADPEWQEGVAWGKPRTGHWEGPVKFHIADVLANIDRHCPPDGERSALRLIALIHDSFKYRVNESKPRVGSNHHAYLARCFAERYITDSIILDIIELHDEAYNSWLMGAHKGHWARAEERIDNLLRRIGPALPLYLRFYHADNETESKDQAPLIWFEQMLRDKGFDLSFC